MSRVVEAFTTVNTRRLLASEDLRAYGDFVRAYAPAMLHPARRVVVETGAGWFVPLAGFSVFGTLTLAFTCGLAVLVALGWWTIPRYVPRRSRIPTTSRARFRAADRLG